MNLPVGFDFHFFWSAAQQLLHGGSPYAVGGFFSPFPLALLLAPLALLPFLPAYALWTLLKLWLLARATSRIGFLKALLFFPVAFDLQQGQIDLLVFALALRLDWLGAALSSLRPQLAIWIIPFCAWQWWKDGRYDQFWKTLAGIGALYGLSTLIQPGWWQEWLGALAVARQYNEQSASLFGLATVLPLDPGLSFLLIALAAVAAFALVRPRAARTYWQLVAMFNPVANAYSLVVLFDQADWVAIGLAFCALPLSLVTRTNAAWAIVPLYLLAKDRWLPALSRRARVPADLS